MIPEYDCSFIIFTTSRRRTDVICCINSNASRYIECGFWIRIIYTNPKLTVVSIIVVFEVEERSTVGSYRKLFTGFDFVVIITTSGISRGIHVDVVVGVFVSDQ